MIIYVLVGVAGLLYTLWVFRSYRITQQRNKLIAHGILPSEYTQILEKQMPLVARLPEQQSRRLKGLVVAFLDEKSFSGAGGLVITDEMRVLIAANACLLLLGREKSWYHGLKHIIVYPEVMIKMQRTMNAFGVMEEKKIALAGESWSYGCIALAWSQTKHGATCINDGRNVVIHEAAHQLDQADAQGDGCPDLDGGFNEWAKVLGRQYKKLVKQCQVGEKSMLGDYAATHPAEFFAVGTEYYFEQGKRFKLLYPDLYQQFYGYYRVDTATWEL